MPYTRTKFLIHLAIALGLLVPVFLLTVAHVTVKELFLILFLMAAGSCGTWDGMNTITLLKGTYKSKNQVVEVTGIEALLRGLLYLCSRVAMIFLAISTAFEKLTD